MKREKGYYEGYLTIEATFIVSIAIMIIVLLMYWGFYCYDKSVSVQCSYLAVLRGSNEWEMSNGELESFVLQNLNKLTDETFLYTKKGNLDVSVGITEIKAKINGGMEILFSGIRGDTMTKWELNSEKKASRLKPASFIRKYQLLGK